LSIKNVPLVLDVGLLHLMKRVLDRGAHIVIVAICCSIALSLCCNVLTFLIAWFIIYYLFLFNFLSRLYTTCMISSCATRCHPSSS